MIQIKKYIQLLAIPFCLMMVSCDEDFPKNVESNEFAVLESIKIKNVGLAGDSVVVGKVDEINKRVTFAELHKTTNLTNLQFEYTLSDGATLQIPSTNFTIADGDLKKDAIFRVQNGKRYRDYIVTIAHQQFGANFENGYYKLFDFSANPFGESLYPDFIGTNTRSADFDGSHALIVSREGGVKPHLIKMFGDNGIIKTGKANALMLNTTGIAGGTFPINSGRLAQGHIYLSNLSGNITTVGGHLKIYHWTDTINAPSQPPTLLYTFGDDASEVAMTIGKVRYGDNMSADIDATGKGYLFFGSNSVIGNLLRLTVTNFTEITDPKVFAIPAANQAGAFMTMNPVDGVKGEYTYTGGLTAPIMLIDADANLLYKMKATTEPFKSACDVRIIKFNRERYLILTKADTKQALYVYNITPGATTAEALERLESEVPSPVFEYSLDGSATSSVALASTGWGVANNKLYIFGAAPKAGFAILELPKKGTN